MKTKQASDNHLFRVILPMVLLNLIISFLTIQVSEAQTIPRAPACTDSPLHPMAGKSYTYSVSIASPYTTPQSYDWFVTDNQSFIAASALVSSSIILNDKSIIDAGAGYHDPATGTNSITIKWSNKAVVNSQTKPYFLVIHYKGTNGSICQAMNLKAYKIDPFNAFTLDITNMNGSVDLGLDGSNLAVQNKLCAADLSIASYDGTKMIFDYGTNELLFKVVAANFSGGWKPSVKVSGISGSQTIGAIEWSTTTTFDGSNSFTKNMDTWTPANKVPAPVDNLTENGETMYIKVTIQNNDFEGLTDTPITLALNGITDDNVEDVHYTDCLTDGYTNDVATQIILARPALTSNTGSPIQQFIP